MGLTCEKLQSEDRREKKQIRVLVLLLGHQDKVKLDVTPRDKDALIFIRERDQRKKETESNPLFIVTTDEMFEETNNIYNLIWNHPHKKNEKWNNDSEIWILKIQGTMSRKEDEVTSKYVILTIVTFLLRYNIFSVVYFF